MKWVHLIAVSYESDAAAVALVDSLAAARPDARVVLTLVETSERPRVAGELEGAVRRHPGMELVRPLENLGYFGGARRALPLARDAEWVGVLNADMRFDDPRFFAVLAALDRPAEAAVLAPAVMGPGGRDLNPFLVSRPSAWRMRLYPRLYAFYPLHLAARLVYRAVRHPPRWRGPRAARAIYAPYGAFLLFHRTYFERGGDLEHGAFLFGEEVFVAESCRRLGLAVRYEPSLRVAHAGAVSTGRWISRRIAGYERDAARFLAGRYFARPRRDPS